MLPLSHRAHVGLPMTYEDEAQEHERLTRLLFTLQRKYDDASPEDLERRRVLRAAIDETRDALDRLRRRHRG